MSIGRWLTGFLVAVSAACNEQAASPLVSDPATDFSITGTVSRASHPVPGAVVGLNDQDGQSSKTDSSGRFTLQGVTSGFHTMRVHAGLDGGAFSERTLDVFVAANSEMGELKLPDVVTLRPIEVSGQTLRSIWSRSGDPDFREYKLYRGTPEDLEQGKGTLRYVSTNPDDTTFADEHLTSVSTYAYRVFVLNDNGRLSGSNHLSATTEPRQLITNGGFEDVSSINGMPVDWERSAEGSSRIDSTFSFEGKYSLVMWGGGTRAYVVSTMLPPLEMVPGGTYRLSMAVRSNDLYSWSSWTIRAQYWCGLFSASVSANPRNVVPDSWSLFQTEFSIPTDPSLSGDNCHVTIWAENGGALVDDVQLVRVK